MLKFNCESFKNSIVNFGLPILRIQFSNVGFAGAFVLGNYVNL